ncbi:TetR/AcrR family transcriptional regulator [Cyclobacterium jeungdonense]|uniref:TetR/AcrR family transcriptional regulator n=1 Tax=Cyclobacterium jeungdonense TaxID=708087 RepID=A0ABT8CD98_9BACT|nr:TetR/AcrR family transcriptional regulator [Cyclobacterium jeungdonense]MDN3690381.1 TetR/AcrR family transcriptional regulator [Cyclobacterium jeungdonense]
MGVYERQQKEKKILEAAIHLFSEKGFHATKVDEVAKKARISKGLVYFYYKSKEDLYMAITKKGVDELKEIFNKAFGKPKEKTGLEVMTDLAESYLSFARDKKVFHDAILHFLGLLDQYQVDKEKLNPLILNSQYFTKLVQSHHDLAKLGIKAISTGIKDGSIRPDLHAESTFYTLWSMMIGYCRISGSVSLEPGEIKINTESWKNGFIKLFFEILKGSSTPSVSQPVQGKLF